LDADKNCKATWWCFKPGRHFFVLLCFIGLKVVCFSDWFSENEIWKWSFGKNMLSIGCWKAEHYSYIHSTQTNIAILLKYFNYYYIHSYYGLRFSLNYNDFEGKVYRR
jgi:hypothetical protein